MMATRESWISRHGLAWLLVAQIALIAPHLQRLPIWAMLVWAVCALWRIQVFRGQWMLPTALIKILIVSATVVGIRASYGNMFSLEPTVALLISGFSLKLIESSTRRDAYLLLFLGFFVATTEFLFEQNLFITLYMLVPVLLLIASLIALQQNEPLRFTLQPLRLAAVMSAQAIPLLLLMFLIFPRIAPLWRVPMPGGGAHTGMSDSLAPGEIAHLSQSDELAFRVVFSKKIPAQHDLYWRGLVLDYFDGRAWRTTESNNQPLTHAENLFTRALPSLDYDVYLEPTYQRWLYALSVAEPLSTNAFLAVDYHLQAHDVIAEKISYSVRTRLQQPLDIALTRQQRHQNLLLPKFGNPRAREWAQQLAEASQDERAIVNRVLENFRHQEFFYTLNPPPLGNDSVDEFLFQTRRGFCEHFASSFVFLMRAAGIPARVVVGYQGGEINPITQTVLIHQFDAHAWAEVWFDGAGWVRFDPTAAVAPQRIEHGLERAIGTKEFLSQQPLSIARYREFAWINNLRFRIDALNYAWTRWVVNYRDDTQLHVLNALLGEISPVRMAIFFVGSSAAILLIVALTMIGRYMFGVRLPLEQRLYLSFCARLARLGYPRPVAMPAGDYAHWVLQQQPGWKLVAEVTQCFEMLSYRRLSESQRALLLRRLKRLTRSRNFESI